MIAFVREYYICQLSILKLPSTPRNNMSPKHRRLRNVLAHKPRYFRAFVSMRFYLVIFLSLVDVRHIEAIQIAAVHLDTADARRFCACIFREVYLRQSHSLHRVSVRTDTSKQVTVASTPYDNRVHSLEFNDFQWNLIARCKIIWSELQNMSSQIGRAHV